MIDFYFWTTPNGYKVLMFLEETGLAHHIVSVNISQGEQFDPDYLRISPNNKIPAIVDNTPPDGESSVAIFESGAILLYLAEKTGQLIPSDSRSRADVLQWLFWQVGGLGPMLGQNLHFGQYAPESLPYAIDRYVNETGRLYGVMDKHLADREYFAGKFSIADIASYPWVLKHPFLQPELEDFPNLKRWFDKIAERPATKRAYERGAEINTTPTITDASRQILIGQSAATVAA